MLLPSIARAICSLIAVTSVLATTFLERPFPDSVHDAPVIVRGRVGDHYANWAHLDDGSRRIYTFYELHVSEWLKGAPGGTNIVIRELGGEKDGVGMQVAGASSFERDEDTVVFLSPRNSDGSYDVRGMMMGKYNITRDSNGEEILRGPGIHPRADADEQNVTTGQDGSGRKWTLAALRQLIDDQKNSASSPRPAVKSASSTHPVPPLAPSPEVAESPRAAAPQLQNSVHEAGGFPWVAVTLGAASLVAIALLFLAMRSR